ncbi:hypothetical protein EDB81DRAFT_673020, partial [Dactylonectria macrodidyma]
LKMQFQETGPDQVLDIEQSETTKWLQHTGWPQLFRNQPLDIIAASTLQPRPGYNEDYLLGSWQGTQVWSSVAVEAQLQIILRGVDLMFDRAKFTLARTDAPGGFQLDGTSLYRTAVSSSGLMI